MFLITSINGSQGAWMQKSKQKTTIGDSLDQQCQPTSEAFESLSLDFVHFNYCLALQLFWVSNYSFFINNYISWVESSQVLSWRISLYDLEFISLVSFFSAHHFIKHLSIITNWRILWSKAKRIICPLFSDCKAEFAVVTQLIKNYYLVLVSLSHANRLLMGWR